MCNKYVFRRIPADKVSKNWDSIGKHIEKALPTTSVATIDRSANLLKSILKEELEVWCAGPVECEEGMVGISTIATIKVSIDLVSGGKNLIIYSLTAVKTVKLDLYDEGYRFLTELAVEKGCQNIIAYTGIKRLAVLSKQHGADISYVINLPLLKEEI